MIIINSLAVHIQIIWHSLIGMVASL